VLYYVYPQWHTVSFTLIARKHIAELKKYFRVYEIDELAFPTLGLATKPIMLVHPTFYALSRFSAHRERLIPRIRALIGVDTADGDRITGLAVSITNYCDAMVVPSNWARDAYVDSGVRTPVYVVPHGVGREYFEKSVEFKHFGDLLALKRSRGYKYLLFYCWHSEWRKGFDLVLDVYDRIRRERKDIVLICKLMTEHGVYQPVVKQRGGIIVAGWLKEDQKIELYDLCDVYLLFTRGGGFELNGLEALARGEVVVAADKGSWTDYMPKWSLVKSHYCECPLKDNPIHAGRGVEIDVNIAAKKVLDVIDDLDEHKAKVREHVEKNIKPAYGWDNVGKMLADVVYEVGDGRGIRRSVEGGKSPTRLGTYPNRPRPISRRGRAVLAV